MSNFQWKIFDEIRKHFDDHITITNSGSLGFPKKFRDDHIGGANFALLFYDASQRAIGICFQTDESDKVKLKISHSDKYGSSVNARTFFKTNKIDCVAQSGKYQWENDDYEGKKLFVIRLDKVLKPKIGETETKTGSDASQEAGASTMPQG